MFQKSLKNEYNDSKSQSLKENNLILFHRKMRVGKEEDFSYEKSKNSYQKVRFNPKYTIWYGCILTMQTDHELMYILFSIILLVLIELQLFLLITS